MQATLFIVVLVVASSVLVATGAIKHRQFERPSGDYLIDDRETCQIDADLIRWVKEQAEEKEEQELAQYFARAAKVAGDIQTGSEQVSDDDTGVSQLDKASISQLKKLLDFFADLPSGLKCDEFSIGAFIRTFNVAFGGFNSKESEISESSKLFKYMKQRAAVDIKTCAQDSYNSLDKLLDVHYRTYEKNFDRASYALGGVLKLRSIPNSVGGNGKRIRDSDDVLRELDLVKGHFKARKMWQALKIKNPKYIKINPAEDLFEFLATSCQIVTEANVEHHLNVYNLALALTNSSRPDWLRLSQPNSIRILEQNEISRLCRQILSPETSQQVQKNIKAQFNRNWVSELASRMRPERRWLD